MTAGLKCPPLTPAELTISLNRTMPWTRPTTAKSDPDWAFAAVATNSVTTVQMTKTRSSVPTSSAM